MNLLTIDWDYFFAIPHQDAVRWVTFYDWGHNENRNPALDDVLWGTRAAQFLLNEEPLPMVERWETFAERFTLSEDAVLLYSNSHLFAALDEYGDLRNPAEVEQVWLYDAHHDSGYGQSKPERITCEDWLGWYTTNGAQTHVRYPWWHATWREVDQDPSVKPTSRAMDSGTVPTVRGKPVTFDAVQVCRSDSWVPPWCDEQFEQFLFTWGVEEWYGPDETFRNRRPWDLAEVEREVEMRRELIERMRNG